MKRYKILTFLITVLRRLRRRFLIGEWMGLKTDSLLIEGVILFDDLSEKRGVLIECCDCGLEHKFFKKFDFGVGGDILQIYSLRPVGYDYTWRLGDQDT